MGCVTGVYHDLHGLSLLVGHHKVGSCLEAILFVHPVYPFLGRFLGSKFASIQRGDSVPHTVTYKRAAPVCLLAKIDLHSSRTFSGKSSLPWWQATILFSWSGCASCMALYVSRVSAWLASLSALMIA